MKSTHRAALVLFYFLGNFLPLSAAIAFPGPIMTKDSEKILITKSSTTSVVSTHTPIVTTKPQLFQAMLTRSHDLTLVLRGSTAPDSICGYVNEDINNPRSCSKGKCGVYYQVADTKDQSRAACMACYINEVPYIKSKDCIDSKAYFGGVETRVTNDGFSTRICTESEKPYCYPIWLMLSTDVKVKYWDCSSKAFNSVRNGAKILYTSANSFTPRDWREYWEQAEVTPVMTTSTKRTDLSESGIHPISKPPIGFIVGIVIGSLAILVGGALGITWMITREHRRKRRKDCTERANSATTNSLPELPVLPGPSGSSHERPEKLVRSPRVMPPAELDTTSRPYIHELHGSGSVDSFTMPPPWSTQHEYTHSVSPAISASASSVIRAGRSGTPLQTVSGEEDVEFQIRLQNNDGFRSHI